MTLDGLIAQINAARYDRDNDVEALEMLKHFIASRPKTPAHIPPLYPPRWAKRESLMELRWKHLDHVDDMASREFDRAETFRILRNNYEHFYGRLRKLRRDEVPSDEQRKDRIVNAILDIVEARRAQILQEEEDAAYAASK